MKGDEVTLRQAATAIVRMARDTRHWSREECIDFAERQLTAAQQRGERRASDD